jgi:site-specific DNA-cytosine methylase
MIVLSLFDGMSCGYEALKRAGIPVTKYYASEIDKYAIQIAMKNHPDIIQLGDVENWREWDIEKPDLIIGGSPCQGFSFAGKQLAFDDPRSKLFFTMMDIIEHYKPRFKLLENVKMKKEHLGVITNYMGVEPMFINSALVSAQNRQRYYWFNWDATEPEDKGILLKDSIENGFVDKDKAYCIDANYWKGGNKKSYFEKRRRQLVFEDCRLGQYRKLTPIECEWLQTLPDNYTEGVSNTQRYKMLGNGWTVDVIAHILKHMGKR